ncbi:MAG: ribokinase [Actinomycetota bacterium]|nr:ribokinase [Actinomycetota bacterium]
MDDRGGARNDEVVVVGSINVDLVLSVAHRPAPGETVGDARLERHPGGKGANQALAAARSGARSALIGRVGADAEGERRVGELAAGGVRTELIATSATAPTGLAVITVTEEGENAIVVAPGANGELGASELARAEDALGGARVLVVQLEIPLGTVRRAVEMAGAGTTVIVNAAPARPLPPELLAKVDLLVVNELEAGSLLGTSIGGRSDAMAAAAALVVLGPAGAVITLGPLGAVGHRRGSAAFHVPAPPTTVRDTTGAGDAFVGALAARLAAGEGLEDAVGFAVAVGAATVAHHGAEPHLPPTYSRR